MRTLVEVVARRGRGGRTELPVVRASGQFAVRRTGPASVHLVATAFGPLGGDDASIRLVVEHGATLTVATVAASVALPAREGGQPSVQRITATVAGALALVPEPTVVTARAHHRAELVAELEEAAALTVTERVLLGRSGEEPGRWTGTTRVLQTGRPLLHTTIDLGPGAPAWLPPVAPRAYCSTVRIGPECDERQGGKAVAVATRSPADGAVDHAVDHDVDQAAVRLPIAGGWSATAWGDRLHRVEQAMAELTTGTEDVA